MKSSENDESTVTTFYTDTVNVRVNENLGVAKNYDRKLYDDNKRKSEFKDKTFDGKKTYYDKISGENLHRDQNAARRKYHMKSKDGKSVSKKWAQHSADVDHVNSIKSVHAAAKYNPFLTDSDIKEIVNSDENLQILSSSFNRSKSDKSIGQIILDPTNGLTMDKRIELGKRKIKSDLKLHRKFTEKSVQNYAKDHAVDTLIPLTTEAVNQMIQVAQGRKDLKEAADSMGRATVDIVVVGGAKNAIMQAITNQLTNSSNPILKVLPHGYIVQMVDFGLKVQKSAVKYVNGEINGEEFIDEIGVSGSLVVAGMIGNKVGEIVGGIIGTAILPGIGTAAGEVIGNIAGTIITTVACTAIMTIHSVKKHMNDFKLKEKQIKRLEAAALKEMSVQRIKFKEIVQENFRVWDETMQNGFDQIILCACEETYNLQGITDGLDKILSIFGKSVAFKTLDEYEEQLDMPLKFSF